MARAHSWLASTPPDKLLSVDVAAARALGIYPMTTDVALASGAPQPANAEPFARTETERARSQHSR